MQVWLLLLTNQVLRLVNIAPDKGFPCNNVSEAASLCEILQFQEKKKKEWVTAEVLIHPQGMCDGGGPSKGRGKKQVVCYLCFVKQNFFRN